MNEMDDIGQEFDRAVRLALTATGQLAERIARRNETRARLIQHAAEQQARQMREELWGEMQAARLVYRPATQPQWWQNATEQDAARAWQYAVGWSTADLQAQPAATIIREMAEQKWPEADLDEVLNRHRRSDQVEDLQNTAADLESAHNDRIDAAEREHLGQEFQDEAERVRDDDPARADALTREAEHLRGQAAAAEDSIDGSGEYARAGERELVGVQSGAACAARLDSAPGFARPAKEAIGSKGQGNAKVRAARDRGAGNVRDAELER